MAILGIGNDGYVSPYGSLSVKQHNIKNASAPYSVKPDNSTAEIIGFSALTIAISAGIYKYRDKISEFLQSAQSRTENYHIVEKLKNIAGKAFDFIVSVPQKIGRVFRRLRR